MAELRNLLELIVPTLFAFTLDSVVDVSTIVPSPTRFKCNFFVVDTYSPMRKIPSVSVPPTALNISSFETWFEVE